jgi:hypothetical protein
MPCRLAGDLAQQRILPAIHFDVGSKLPGRESGQRGPRRVRHYLGMLGPQPRLGFVVTGSFHHLRPRNQHLLVPQPPVILSKPWLIARDFWRGLRSGGAEKCGGGARKPEWTRHLPWVVEINVFNAFATTRSATSRLCVHPRLVNRPRPPGENRSRRKGRARGSLPS